jgi:hypothetical protein
VIRMKDFSKTPPGWSALFVMPAEPGLTSMTQPTGPSFDIGTKYNNVPLPVSGMNFLEIWKRVWSNLLLGWCLKQACSCPSFQIFRGSSEIEVPKKRGTGNSFYPSSGLRTSWWIETGLFRSRFILPSFSPHLFRRSHPTILFWERRKDISIGCRRSDWPSTRFLFPSHFLKDPRRWPFRFCWHNPAWRGQSNGEGFPNGWGWRNISERLFFFMEY